MTPELLALKRATGRKAMAWFRNFYRCENCETEWDDEWSCGCDDDCPECGARHMQPYQSDQLSEDDDVAA